MIKKRHKKSLSTMYIIYYISFNFYGIYVYRSSSTNNNTFDNKQELNQLLSSSLPTNNYNMNNNNNNCEISYQHISILSYYNNKTKSYTNSEINQEILKESLKECSIELYRNTPNYKDINDYKLITNITSSSSHRNSDGSINANNGIIHESISFCEFIKVIDCNSFLLFFINPFQEMIKVSKEEIENKPIEFFVKILKFERKSDLTKMYYKSFYDYGVTVYFISYILYSLYIIILSKYL